MGGVVVGGRLRSRLLVGVAALAMAAPASTRALAQSVDKWQPYLEAGGMVGINANSFGDVDIFLPLWQDQTSLFFGDLRGTFTAAPSEEGNFGLGYRTQLNTDWILGGYGFIDIQNSKNSNLFYQGSLGVELLSVDWDFRLNGYLPFNGGGQTVSGGNGTNGNLGIFGNNFGFQTNDVKKEYALYGFDGEVGWRVPVFPVDGDMDLRVYAGGYYFARGDVDTIAGPRGRIEARLYDIDFLGLQSRLTAQGVIQWDQPRGTQGFAGLELRIPLGMLTGSTGPKLNPLDRRMVDRVQRDVDIVTETAKKKGNVTLQEVQVDELTVTTHTAVFADGQGTDGDNGTQKHPTDLNNAPSLGQALGSNAVIIAQGDRGNLNVTNPVQLSNGQALIGGGSVVDLTLIGGKHNGEIIPFSFPGSRPTVVGDNPTSALIVMASGSQNRVTGLDLTGQFHEGILGTNMDRAIVSGNFISGGTGDGVEQEAFWSDGLAHSQFIHVFDNSITGMTESGIKIDTDVTNPGTVVSQTIALDNNTLVGNLYNGITVDTRASNGASVVQALTIDPSTITFNSSNGIVIHNYASLANASISQTAIIDDNTIGYNGSRGIFINNQASSAGSIGQVVLLAGDTVNHNSRNGIYVSNRVVIGSRIDQTLGITSSSFNFSSDDGMHVENVVFSGSTLLQAITLDHVDDRGNSLGGGGNGIEIETSASGPGTRVTQSVQIDSSTFASNGESGIKVDFTAYSNAVISATTNILDNVITSNGITDEGDGIAFPIDGSSATIFHTVSIAGNTIAYNRDTGIRDTIEMSDGLVVSQTADITGNTIFHNSSGGIHIENEPASGGAPTGLISQHVRIADNTINSNGFNGVFVYNRLSSSTISQTIEVLNDIVSFNTSNGIRFNNIGYGAVGQLDQTVVVSGSVITSNGVNGFLVRNRFGDSAGLSQDISIAASTIAENASHGVFISSSLYGTGPFTQNVSILSSRIVSNPGGGIDIKTFGSSSASVTEFVTIGGNVVSYNGSNGIRVQDQVTNGSTLSQTVSITGNLVNFNSSRGIDVRAIGYSSSTVVQDVLVDGNTVTHNGSDGIRVKGVVGPQGGVVVGGSLTQTVVVTDNSVDHSSKNGIYIGAFAASVTAFTQNVTVAGNRVTSSAVSNGIAIITSLDTVSNPATEILSVTNNFVKYTGSDGIVVLTTLTGSGTTLTQTSFAIDHNTVTSVPGIGIFVSNDVTTGTTLSQGGIANHATINDNTVSYADIGGIIVSNSVVGAGASLAQILDIDPNTVLHVGYDGIFVHTRALSGAVAVQKISIDGNTVSDVAGGSNAVGIGVLNEAGDAVSSATISQSLAITDNTVTHIAASVGLRPVAAGIYVGNSAGVSAHISQSAFIATNTVTSISGVFAGAGIINVNDAAESGALITQTLGINNNTVSYVVGSNAVGIGSVNDVSQAATISQALTIDPNTVQFIGGNDSVAHATYAIGILVQNHVASNAVLSQTVDILLNHVTDIQASSHAGGIVVETYLSRGASVAGQAISIGGNFVSHVVGSSAVGIAVLNQVGDSLGGGDLSQTLAITGNSVTHVAANDIDGSAIGVYVSNGAGFSAHISQSVVIGNNTVTSISATSPGLTAAGVVAVNTAAFSGATITQGLGINDNTVTDIHGFIAVGIYVGNGVSSGATILQALTIDPNTVSLIGGTSANGGAAFAAGILVDNNVGPDALLSQTVNIVGNHVTTIAGYFGAVGIEVETHASGAGSIVSQTVNIGASSGGGNTVANVSAGGTVVFGNVAGIEVFNDIASGAVAVQTVYVLANKVTGITAPQVPASRVSGIIVYNRVISDGTLTQVLAVAQNSVSNIDGDGIKLVNFASDPSVISQTVAIGNATISGYTFGGNRVTNVGRDGIDLRNVALGNSTVSQVGTMFSNFVSHPGGIGGVGVVGIGVELSAGGGTTAANSIVHQSLAVTGNNVQRNNVGISFGVTAAGGSSSGNYATGRWTMTNNTVKYNNFGGNFKVKGYSSHAVQFVNMTSGNVFQSNNFGIVAGDSHGVQTISLHTGNNTFNNFGPNIITNYGPPGTQLIAP